MKTEKFLLDQIKCDQENLQVMIDMLPECKTKGEYRTIVAVIKETVKSIRETKCILEDCLYLAPRPRPALFEVPEPEPEFTELNSYFGTLE